MEIIGLTGSIGMGKSFVASVFTSCGVPVFDADKAVHGLFSDENTIDALAKAFPEAVKNGEINRDIIAKEAFVNRAKLRMLEEILHPRVFEAQRRFIQKEYHKGRKYIVLEVPLLFEKHVHQLCDYVLVVTASPFLQKKRVLNRQLMTNEKFRAIEAAQMGDKKKRYKADFIIYTGQGKAHTRRIVRNLVKYGLHRKG